MAERLKELGDLTDIEEPWCQLTEREPAASGSLLAAYDTVDALTHRVEFLTVTCAASGAGMEEAQTYAQSCEDRIGELQDEIVESERDWDELDSRHQEQSTVVRSQARRITVVWSGQCRA